jgi:hypothetical protein
LFVLSSYVAAARIYREDLRRVTTSRNRLSLSLSKRIRHRLIAKINGKRRSWTCKDLGWISTDYLRARRTPTPNASPRPARPGEARRVSARVYFSISPFLHILASA